ncbi:J domain-containing protein [Hymenobacter sediminicola]|uniref:J domain-containing protein n=1 Tax=Hymenobacter sediminicola TaxID=2761579 RepID=A0A7G7W8P0_9BACT|nr:J domain-containing protein [Hymenobacter sediminicola]QNH62733.1 J domain-containing protein [Hymenobacter sediminicola]
MSTHYMVLGVSEQATAAEIRQAYRRLVLLTHPDRTPDPAAHRRYIAINEAYETLSNATRRAAYDQQLRRLVQPAPETDADTEPHPDPALRRRGYRRAKASARPPLQPMHIRYAAEFRRILPRFRIVAYLSLLSVALLTVDFNRTETLSDETVQEFEYVTRSSKRGSSSYFIVYTQNSNFKVDNDTELEKGDQIRVLQTPWFGKVKTVMIRSGKMQGDTLQISRFDFLWMLCVVVAGSALLFLCVSLRPDRAFNVGFTNSVAVFFLFLYLCFV